MENDGTRNNGTSSDVVAALIRAVGRRQEPPREAYEAVRAAAQEALHRRLAARRQRRIVGWAAAAAIVAGVAIAVMTPWNPVGGRADTVATVGRIVGSVEVETAGKWRPLLRSGRQLASGDRIRTHAGGRLALELAGGESLRIAPSTGLALHAPRELELTEGTLYLDRQGSVGTGIRIATPAGTAHDVGTQYELRISGGALRLRVREGRVEIERAGGRLAGGAGEQLEIGPLGDVRRSAIAADDPAWHWAESLAPAPDIDGRPASVLLEWVARETGKKLAYADDAIRRRAASVVLHGNIRHLAPLEALEVMLATTDLECVVVGDTMEIRARTAR